MKGLVGKLYLLFAVFILSIVMMGVVYAADAPSSLTDDQRLAFLAANVKQFAGTSDYTMECGPYGDIIPVWSSGSSAPMTSTPNYCVLRTDDGKITFGTYVTFGIESSAEAVAARKFFAIVSDSQFSAQIRSGDVSSGACNSFFSGISEGKQFHECRSAIKNLNTWMYSRFTTEPDTAGASVDDKSLYFIVTQNTVAAQTEAQNANVWSRIAEFFRGLVGMTTAGVSLGVKSPVEFDQFHHAYFSYAKKGTAGIDRTVVGVWQKTSVDGTPAESATIIFKGFAQDMSKMTPTLPADVVANLLPGYNNKQVLQLSTFDSTKSANKIYWKTLTSKLRITAVNAAPFESDSCGNGIAGFDEDCDGAAMKDTFCAELAGRKVNGVTISYASGDLSCTTDVAGHTTDGKTPCKYDTSKCIACDDADQDKSFGGQGPTGVLSQLAGGFSLGTAQPYGTFLQSTSALEDARVKALKLKYTILPITYDMAMRYDDRAQDFFTIALGKAKTAYATCAVGKSTSAEFAACEKLAYGDTARFQYARSAAMRNIMTLSTDERALKTAGVLGATESLARCTLTDNEYVCPDGYSSLASGITTNYTVLFSRLKTQGVSPIIRITLGACAGGACGPYGDSTTKNAFKFSTRSGELTTKSSYVAEELNNIYGYCFVVADGLKYEWGNVGGATTILSTFIVIGNPDEAKMPLETYNEVYDHCSRGIKAAIGESATVLYGVPADSSSALFTNIRAAETAHKPYDGVYIESPIVGNQRRAFGIEEFTAAISAFNIHSTPMFVRVTDWLDNTGSLYGTRLPIAGALANVNILYDTVGTRTFSTITPPQTSEETAKETPSEATRYWAAIMDGLTPRTDKHFVYTVTRLPVSSGYESLPAGIYMFVQTASPASPAASVMTIINMNADPVKLNSLVLSSCGVSKITEILPAEDKPITPIASFDKTIPANSIVLVEFSGSPTCLAPSDAAKCKVMVDCMDANADNTKYLDGTVVKAADVKPNTKEICGNGVDDNCNGVKDEAGCVPPTSQPRDIKSITQITCDYDGECAAGTTDPTLSKCVDCFDVPKCPVDPVLYKTVGAYRLKLGVNSANVPYLAITSSGGCAAYLGATLPGAQKGRHGEDIEYAFHNPPLSDVTMVAGATTPMPLSYTQAFNGEPQTQTRVTLTASGTVTDRTGNWKITVSGPELKAPVASCWGPSGTAFTGLTIPYAAAPRCLLAPERGTCKLEGETCDTTKNCCTNRLCVSGVCARLSSSSQQPDAHSCEDNGHVCGGNNNCCSNICDPVEKKCINGGGGGGARGYNNVGPMEQDIGCGGFVDASGDCWV